MLTEAGDMEHDAEIKNAKFINSAVEIRQTFKAAAPSEQVKSLKIYSSSFYGSNLWDLDGSKARRVFSSWNTAVKLAWGLPQQTRTYFLQKLLCCGFSSARVDILTRFVNFFRGLLASASLEVQVLSRLLARDRMSVTGKNLALIKELTGLNPWAASLVRIKEALTLQEQVGVPPTDIWRLPYLVNLWGQWNHAYFMAAEEEQSRLSDLIHSLVVN